MRRWGAVRRFVEEEEGGQALLLVLCFLVPMVLAFGMVARTDWQIVRRVQLAHAADAAALAGGNVYARAMNQVAINNLQVVKIASFQTSMAATLFGSAAVFYKMFFAFGPKESAESTPKMFDGAEVLKVIRALKCWYQVFKVAWKACSASLRALPAASVTVIGGILAGAIALVSCPVALIAVMCMACEVLELAQFLLIAQWWAFETAGILNHGFRAYTDGRDAINRLSNHSRALVDGLPTAMAIEMREAARRIGADDAFLSNPVDFKLPEPLRVSQTLVPAGMYKVTGLALHGFNGADAFDILKYYAQAAVPPAAALWGKGARGSRGVFVNSDNEKELLNLDWNAGMLYFEGPAPDVYTTSFPWGDFLEYTGLGYRIKDYMGQLRRGWTNWRQVLGLIELFRTTTDAYSTETQVPRGPVFYYNQWLNDVHMGQGDYWLDQKSQDDGHTPLGNPDTLYPRCYNDFHLGCDGNRTLFRLLDFFSGGTDPNSLGAKLIAKIRSLGGDKLQAILDYVDKFFRKFRALKKWLNKFIEKFGGCQFLPCNGDWTTYTVNWAKIWADFATPALAAARFGLGGADVLGDAQLYYHPETGGPRVDFTVTAKMTNQYGRFAKLFPSPGAFGDANHYAVSKFRLYNPSEVHGLIPYLEPPEGSDYNPNYSENVMSQDWRAKLIPVPERDLRGAPAGYPNVLRRIRH